MSSIRYSRRSLPIIFTYQPDYRLTGLAIDILSKYATELVNAIPNGALKSVLASLLSCDTHCF